MRALLLAGLVLVGAGQAAEDVWQITLKDGTIVWNLRLEAPRLLILPEHERVAPQRLEPQVPHDRAVLERDLPHVLRRLPRSDQDEPLEEQRSHVCSPLPVLGGASVACGRRFFPFGRG